MIEFLPQSKIAEYFESGFSYGMIYDLLKRDHPSLFEEKEFFQVKLQCLRNVLMWAGFRVKNDQYLKSPQAWKLQFRFPANFTLEQIREECSRSSREGQKITVKNRRKNGTYKDQEFKREWSPLCKEFYQARGFTEEETQEKILRICANGAKACLSTRIKSDIEREISRIMKELGFDYSREFCINLRKEEKVFRKKRYFFDFYISKLEMLLEVQGTYWHCDPRFFEATELVKFPEQDPVEAQYVWNRDAHKKDVAISRGYRYAVVWEADIKNPSIDIYSLLKEILCV